MCFYRMCGLPCLSVGCPQNTQQHNMKNGDLRIKNYLGTHTCTHLFTHGLSSWRKPEDLKNIHAPQTQRENFTKTATQDWTLAPELRGINTACCTTVLCLKLGYLSSLILRSLVLLHRTRTMCKFTKGQMIKLLSNRWLKTTTETENTCVRSTKMFLHHRKRYFWTFIFSNSVQPAMPGTLW